LCSTWFPYQIMFEFVTSNNEWRCHYVDTHYFSGAHGLLSTFTFNMNCFEKYLHGLGSIFNRKIWLNWKWHYWKTEKSFSIKSNFSRGCRCRDRMVVGFTTTYVISAVKMVHFLYMIKYQKTMSFLHMRNIWSTILD
jgi:hypothetical protein